MSNEQNIKELKYLNFPIQVLDGFLENPNMVLERIFKYATCYHANKLKLGVFCEKYESTISCYGYKYQNVIKAALEAEKVFNSFNRAQGDNCPIVGLHIDIFNRFLNSETTEFEKICLLGFLGLKSILQRKTFCKVTNNYWLARMDGKAKSVKDFKELSAPIRKYANEYQTKKIKSYLQDDWGLITYARYTKGFYVSFKLDKEQLIEKVELKRRSTKEKQRKLEEKIILQRVLNKLNNES
ncbi:MAG: hypothetical protein ACON5F_02290 [Jejuia sp.]